MTRRDFVSGLNVVPSLDTEFFHFRVQCGSFQAEAFRGTVGAADHSLALAEDAKDVFAFRGVQVRIRRPGGFFGQLRVRRAGARSTEPWVRMTDLSMKFSSSRTLPGQRHLTSALQGLGGNRFDAPAHAFGMAAEEIAN